MNKGVKGLIVVALIAGVGAIALLPWLQARKEDAGETTRRVDPPLPVSVYPVERQAIEDRIRVNGSVRADEEAELRPEISGKITEIAFVEGQPVEAGQLLVRMNDAELRAEERRLKNAVKLAERTEERLRNLLERGSVSQENYDRALSNRNSARADLELVMARLQKTIIQAPFDGVVGLKYVSEGAYVTPSSQIAGIHKLDRIKIDFAVPEKHALAVRLGDRIEFEIASLSERFSGEVYAIQPQIDAVTRTLPIRAVAANPNRNLLPGSFADVSLVLGSTVDALMVPTEAVIPGLSAQRVYVLENGVAKTRSVVTGRRNERSVEIVEGLQAGELVITSGLLQLRDGMSVTVQAPTTDTPSVEVN